MTDPIDDFLNRDFAANSASELRERILMETTRALQRRRYLARLPWAGYLAASFLAGVGTVLLWHFAQMPHGTTQNLHTTKTEAKRESPVPTPNDIDASLTALDLEWRAFDSKDNRAALFFAAAKRYLDDRQDYESALRCYGQALDALPPEELQVRPEDDWLVMALKEARIQERNDALGNP